MGGRVYAADARQGKATSLGPRWLCPACVGVACGILSASGRQSRAEGGTLVMATHTLSLRRYWVMYKRTMRPLRYSRREEIIAQNAFYMGARVTMKVLNRMIEIDESEEALKAIQRHARTIQTLQGLKPRARRH
jgi:hypothetical protein